jgi:hypothetical protein
MPHATRVPGLQCLRSANREKERVIGQIGWRPSRRAAVAAMVLAFSCLLPACSSSSLYFHNQAYEDATKEAKGDVGKLDVTAAFTSLSMQSESLARDEDQAAIAALVALRNRVLVGLIDPSEGDWPDPPAVGRFTNNLPAARLDELINIDLQILKAGQTDASEDDYRLAAQRLIAKQNFVNASDASLELFRKLIDDGVKLHKTEPVPPTDCLTATKIANEGMLPDLDEDVRLNFEDLALACDGLGEVEKYLGLFIERGGGTEGTISRAARYYLEALTTKKKSQLEAKMLRDEVDALLKKMGAPDADMKSLTGAMSTLIEKIGDADALARFVSFSKIDAYLECGLIRNLNAAKDEISPPAKAARPDTKCDEKFLGKEGNAALAGLIKAIMKGVEDKVAVERLAVINANIVSLAVMRQRIAAAGATVAFVDKKLQLYQAQLFALFDQYRLLKETYAAVGKLPQRKAAGFADLRGSDADKRNMAEALSGYVASWNYGRIPADLIDFRFLQAQRIHDIQLANLTAANYKAAVAPIADALAAYGAGGITPDTLAEVISNLGILSGIILN